MNKIIASIISIGSLIYGLFVVIVHSNSDHAMTSLLTLAGMPLVFLAESIYARLSYSAGWMVPWLYFFFYLVQWQLIAYIFLVWKRKE